MRRTGHGFLLVPLLVLCLLQGGSLLAAVPAEEAPVPVPPPSGAPSRSAPLNLNSPGAFEGVIPPSGLRRYDWQADLVFFSDSYSGLPALALSGQKGGSGFMLMYSDSSLPRIGDKGTFLRGSGIPVKSTTTSILIGGVSTATYTSDMIDRFDTRAQVFTVFYYQRVWENEFMRAGLLAGLPFAWHNYAVAGTLDDGSPFSRGGHAFGLGFVPGLTASLSSASLLNKGLSCSLFLLYDRLWFESASGAAGKRLRTRLNGVRFGFSAGWRFNFYR